MNSARNLIIVFALILLVLIGGVLMLGNPAGTSTNEALTELKPLLDQANINQDEILQCVGDLSKKDEVDKSIAEATALGFTGTPAVILYNKNTQLGVLLRGSFPGEIIKTTVNGLMNEELSEGVVLYDTPEEDYRLVTQKMENIVFTEDDNYRGNKDGKILMIEYSDYDCQYCAAFHATAQTITNEFPNDLVWIYRQFPLVQLHPGSLKKSYTALCVKDKGGMDMFWTITDYYLGKLSKN